MRTIRLTAPPWAGDFRPQWTVTYPVLGIQTVIDASDAAVAPAVTRAFGAWTDERPPMEAGRAVRIRLEVMEAGEGPLDRAPVRYRLEGARRLHAWSPGGVGYADAEGGHAWARVSRALVADADHFRYGIVEALAYFLLSHLDRQPFHCAAVMRTGRTVLLTGPPGAGKSTLAFLALKAGYTVMAEDLVWVQQHPTFRLWGLTPVIHLPAGARDDFPELAAEPTLLANGEPKVVVAVDRASRPRSPVAERGDICVLARKTGAPRLDRVDRDAIARALQETLQPGFDRFSTTIPAVVNALAPEGGWCLWLGDRPADSIPCLEDLLAGRPEPRP